jgi:putative ABC transport system substrate-binding protein
MIEPIGRREFITLVGGAAALVAGPLAAHAQPAERVRRIGVLLAAGLSDSEYPSLVNAFLERLKELGWTPGERTRLDIRWTGSDAGHLRTDAANLIALKPDVIMTPGSAALGVLLQVTRTVPVVFTIVPDPVGAGFVDSLARPGGNATGFTSFEYNLGGKWLELLKEISPKLKRVAVLRDANIAAGVGQWSAVQTAAPAFGVTVSPINLRAAADVERAITAFARSANGGLIVTSSALSIRHRDLIVRLAARHKLPALYYGRGFVSAGGLISYGPSRLDQFRRAADYVDRVLKGEKPADLPVQLPTKYELTINFTTAKALGLAVPPTLQARADQVIE